MKSEKILVVQFRLSRTHWLLALALASCTTPAAPTNLKSTFYAHNLSAKTIPVVFFQKVKPDESEGTPTRLIYKVDKNVMHEGRLIIPKGSELSSVIYYRQSPHLVVDLIRMPGNGSWTPAQGVITQITEQEGFATLSHVTIPQQGYLSNEQSKH